MNPFSKPSNKPNPIAGASQLPTPTSPQDKQRILEMLSKVQQTIEYLYMRWQDEKEYEDFKGYAEPIIKLLPDGFKLIKMSQHPFGFTFSIGTHAVYQLSLTQSKYGYKRIK